jgi:hypothetical protein
MEAKSNRRAAAPDLADDGRSSGWRLRHHRCVRGVRPGRLRAREGERDRKVNERERASRGLLGCVGLYVYGADQAMFMYV